MEAPTMLRASRRYRLLALIIGASLASNAAVHAQALPVGPISDPVGDLRSSPGYAGPPNPALDVVSADVILNLSTNTFTFTQTMAGPISSLVDPSTGANLGSYSWGINHGFSNLNFSELGLPNVLFDAVLTLNPNGTGSYRGTAAPAGSVTVSGDTLTAVLPVSFLAPPSPPANAPPLLPDTQWSFNLWPRSSILPNGSPLGFGDAQIADFGPNAIDFSPQVVPESSSVALLGLGLVAAACRVGFSARRARREAITAR
jgi:hypothetical protein